MFAAAETHKFGIAVLATKRRKDEHRSQCNVSGDRLFGPNVRARNTRMCQLR